MGVTNNMKLPITERYKSIVGYYWPVVTDPPQSSAGHADGSVVQATFPTLDFFTKVLTRSFCMAAIMTKHGFTTYALRDGFHYKGGHCAESYSLRITLTSLCSIFDFLWLRSISDVK